MDDIIKRIALGANNVAVGQRQQKIKSDVPAETQVVELNKKVDDLSVLVLNLLNNIKKTKTITEVGPITTDNSSTLNKDGIEVNTVLVGTFNNRPHILYVQRDGYQLGSSVFPTLSAASQHLTGKRRSGWEFWKLINGDSVGEVYKK